MRWGRNGIECKRAKVPTSSCSVRIGRTAAVVTGSALHETQTDNLLRMTEANIAFKRQQCSFPHLHTMRALETAAGVYRDSILADWMWWWEVVRDNAQQQAGVVQAGGGGDRPSRSNRPSITHVLADRQAGRGNGWVVYSRCAPSLIPMFHCTSCELAAYSRIGQSSLCLQAEDTTEQHCVHAPI